MEVIFIHSFTILHYVNSYIYHIITFLTNGPEWLKGIGTKNMLCSQRDFYIIKTYIKLHLQSCTCPTQRTIYHICTPSSRVKWKQNDRIVHIIWWLFCVSGEGMFRTPYSTTISQVRKNFANRKRWVLGFP